MPVQTPPNAQLLCDALQVALVQHSKQLHNTVRNCWCQQCTTQASMLLTWAQPTKGYVQYQSSTQMSNGMQLVM